MRIERVIPLAVLTVALAACGKSSTGVRQDQKSYEVVQEGSANGVTSTLQGPGERLPTTSTNADTTTAFTLDPNTATTASATGTMQPGSGTIAGTLPPMTSASPRPTYTPSSPSSPSAPARPRAPQPEPAQPAPPTEEPQPAPKPVNESEDPPAPPPPATTTTVAPPPPTDTSATEPPPSAKKGEDAEEPPPPPPPPPPSAR